MPLVDLSVELCKPVGTRAESIRAGFGRFFERGSTTGNVYIQLDICGHDCRWL